MRLIIKDNYDDAAYFVAVYIKNKIMQRNTSDVPFVLGLPTGSTPLGVYKNLINFYENGQLTFRNVITFNMDEYISLPPENKNSYFYFMYTNFFNFIDIPQNNIFMLRGDAECPETECILFEEKIQMCGGIDLMLGGLGADGHIAFNEPGSSLSSITRVKTLNSDTIEKNARFFENESQVPTQAMTMGIQTIMDSQEIIIFASGRNKALAVRQTIEEGVNHMCPASILQTHAKVCFVMDNLATEELKVKTVNYFKGLQTSIDFIGNSLYNNINTKLLSQPKTLIFSPHPDDDVIGLGALMYNIPKKDMVKIVYMTSGQNGIPAGETNLYLREEEAKSSIASLGYDPASAEFLRLPFYDRHSTHDMTQDERICYDYIVNFNPGSIFICADIDPNGTHKICFNILKNALLKVDTIKPNIYLYKGAWGKFDDTTDVHYHIFNKYDLERKLVAIKLHRSQNPPKFPGSDDRTFDERILETSVAYLFPSYHEEQFKLIKNKEQLSNLEIEDI